MLLPVVASWVYMLDPGKVNQPHMFVCISNLGGLSANHTICIYKVTYIQIYLHTHIHYIYLHTHIHIYIIHMHIYIYTYIYIYLVI